MPSISPAVRRIIGCLIGGFIIALVLLLTDVVHIGRRPTAALPLQSIHEVSYMPYNAGWSAMWTDWDLSLLQRNYETLAAFGANTVRIIIPPLTMGYPILRRQCAGAWDSPFARFGQPASCPANALRSVRQLR